MVNILNKISSILVVLIAIVIVTYSIIDYCTLNYEWRTSTPRNFVELRARFKHYILIDKYKESKSKYVFRLVNPVTDEEYKTHVTENLYYNVYFVGDTIK